MGTFMEDLLVPPKQILAVTPHDVKEGFRYLRLKRRLEKVTEKSGFVLKTAVLDHESDLPKSITELIFEEVIKKKTFAGIFIVANKYFVMSELITGEIKDATEHTVPVAQVDESQDGMRLDSRSILIPYCPINVSSVRLPINYLFGMNKLIMHIRRRELKKEIYGF